MLIIYIIVCLAVSWNYCYSMEQNAAKTDPVEQLSEQISQDFTKTNIQSFERFGLISQIAVQDEENPSKDPACRFFTYDSSDGAVYLTPILEKFDKDLSKTGWDYRLLHGAQVGNKKLFLKALESGADIKAVDHRLDHIKFTVKTPQGTNCTNKDINEGNLVRLAKSERPVIWVKPYSSMFNCDASKLAVLKLNIEILRELKNVLSRQEVCSYEEQEKKGLFYYIDKLESDFKAEEPALQDAQKNHMIPVFPIEPTCKNLIDCTYNIVSCYDDTIKIKALIDKDRCLIGADTEQAKLDHPHLDIDALAALYGRIISVNAKEGKRLINLFDHWAAGRPLFRAHVLRYVIDDIEEETYEDRHLLPGNLVPFAKHVLDGIVHKAHGKSFQQEKIFALLVTLCASKSYDATGKILSPEWKMWHDIFIKNLIETPYGNEFLKNLCDNNKKAIFVPHVKADMRKTLLHNHCAKILSHTGSPLNFDLAQRIAFYWQPDKNFKKAISEYNK